MEPVFPANSPLFWGAVVGFAFLAATLVVRRWARGMPGVRRGVTVVGVFIAAAVVVGLTPSVVCAVTAGRHVRWFTPERAVWWSGGIVAGVLGLAILVRAIVGDPSRGRRRCGRCWYDLSGTVGLRCPECGREARSERGLFRTRRRKRWFALAVVLLVASAGAGIAPVIVKGEWAEWVPTTVVVVAMPYAPQDGTLLDEFRRRVGPEAWDDAHERWSSGWRARLLVGRCRAALARPDRALTATLAAATLAELGAAAAPAADALHALADDAEVHLDVRLMAMWAFTSIPAERERAYALLVRSLDDGDPAVRRSAAFGFRMLDPRESPVLDAPARLLDVASGDSDLSSRRVALQSLGGFRATEATTRTLLDVVDNASGDPVMEPLRSVALRSLAQHGIDEDVLHGALLRSARSEDTWTRLSAVWLIAEHGPYTDEGLDAIVRLGELSEDELSGMAYHIMDTFLESPAPLESRLSVVARALEYPSLQEDVLNTLHLLGDDLQQLEPVLWRLVAEADSSNAAADGPDARRLEQLRLWAETLSRLVAAEEGAPPSPAPTPPSDPPGR